MKSIITLCFFMITNVIHSSEIDAMPTNKEHEIILAAESSSVFGKSTTLQVCYQNYGTNPWHLLDNPTNSTSVYIRYSTGESKIRPSSFNLRYMDTVSFTNLDGTVETDWYSPLPVPLTIATGDRFDFEYSFGLLVRTYDLKLNAPYSVWIEDGDNKLKSNEVEIHFVFTSETIDIFLQEAADENANEDRRKFCVQWLKQIVPDLGKIEIPTYKVTDTTERQTMERKVKEGTDAYRAYFANPTNASAIQDAINRINTQVATDTK